MSQPQGRARRVASNDPGAEDFKTLFDSSRVATVVYRVDEEAYEPVVWNPAAEVLGNGDGAPDLPVTMGMLLLALEDPRTPAPACCQVDGAVLDLVPTPLSGNLVMVQVLDASPRVRAEEELRKARAQFLTQFKSIPVPTLILKVRDSEVILVDYNDAAQEQSRGLVRQMLGVRAHGVLTQHYPDLLEQVLECRLKRSTIESSRWMQNHVTGREVYVNLRLVFVVPDMVMIHAEDLTQARLLEDELRQRKDLFENIINLLPHSLFWKDDQGVYQGVNQSFLTEHGLDSPAGIIGGREADLDVPPEAVDAAMASDEKVLGTGEAVVNQEETIGFADGREFTYLVSKVPLKDGQGRVTGLAGISADITERKVMERELLAAKTEAEEASRAKTAFLANMSHEIRNPLNAILGFVQLLLTDNLTPRQREQLSTVRRSAQTLLTIIEDLLDYSRIETGRMPIKPGEFHLRELVESVTREYGLFADEAGLSLRAEIDDNGLPARHGDEARIRQVLVNLVSNAIKFTRTGEVDIRVRGRGDTQVEFRVSDTGIGIPQDKLAVIFDSFTQVDVSLKKRFAGTGLGLAICKKLVELMEGEIWVRSEPGEGSEFGFRLDLPAAAETRVAADVSGPADILPPRRLRVLLVEDDAVNREFVTDALASLGHESVAAANGLAALEFLGRQTFDIVLMDVQMPVMDGLTATREIRAGRGGTDPATPVVGMSAYASDEHRRRFLAEGMDEYLTKPVDMDRLGQVLLEMSGDREQVSSQAPSCRVEDSGPPAADVDPEGRDRGTDRAGTLDLDHVRQRFAGKRDLLVKVGGAFREQMSQCALGLAETLEGGPGNLEEAAAILHPLVSSAALIGAAGISVRAKDLEEEIKSGRTQGMEDELRAFADLARAASQEMGEMLERLDEVLEG